MIIVYRGFGLLWIFLGGLLAFFLAVLTQSLTVAAAGTAALWIWRGRGRINAETQERSPSPSVYFIPIWLYGAVLVPVSLFLLVVELNSGRVLLTTGDREQAVADEFGLIIDEEADGSDGAPRIRIVDPSTGEIETVQVPQEEPPDDADAVLSDRSTSESALTGSQENRSPATKGAAPSVPQANAAPQQTTEKSDTADVRTGRRRTIDPQKAVADAKASIEAARSARQARSRGNSSVPSASLDRGTSPGEPVTDETILRPGQQLAASWARKWYQVVVVGLNNNGVRVDWVGSNAWRNNQVRRDILRVVSDKDFAGCLQYGHDEPLVPGKALPTGERPSLGILYLCEASGSWIPVRARSVLDDGLVEVDWFNFDSTLNENVEVERLRKFSSNSSSRRQLMSLTQKLAFNTGATTGAIALRTGLSGNEQPGQLWQILAVNGNNCQIAPVDGEASASVAVTATSLRILPDDL